MLSTKEPTWNKLQKLHTCCGSPHSYHKGNCPVKGSKIPGRMSDPEFVQVQDLKLQGLNSREISRQLNLPLEHVNDLWTI